jgi:hypothetical protein
MDIKALKREFDALDETLRRHFGTLENFVTYKRAGAGTFFDPHFCFSNDGSGIAVETTVKFDEGTATDEQLKEHFVETQQLQDEFRDSGCYLALVHYQRRCAEKEERRARRHEAKEARAKVHAELVGQT